MATFAKPTFDVAAYLSRRPTYPAALYDLIYAYHALSPSARWARALDLGCGPGFVAVELARRFGAVVALDPARRMVEAGLQPGQASVSTGAGAGEAAGGGGAGEAAGGSARGGHGGSGRGAARVDYRVGAAEDLRAAGVEDGSVDLIVAAQAAHWFDHARAWPSLLRALRPGGTVAFVAYAEMCLPTHPALDARVAAYARGTLGPHWAQPGRSFTERLLEPVAFPVAPDAAGGAAAAARLPGLAGARPWPTQGGEVAPDPVAPAHEAGAGDAKEAGARDAHDGAWDASSAVRFKADAPAAPGGAPEPWLLRKRMTRPELAGYLHTWSALHAYAEAHGGDGSGTGGGGGDGGGGSGGSGGGGGGAGALVDGFVRDLDGAFGADGTAEIAWPLGVMLVKKREGGA